MARSIREGLDYFPLDCQYDNRYKCIQSQYGMIAFAVIVRIFQMIYAEKGYYTEWDDDTEIVFAYENKLENELLRGIISAAVTKGIFDADMYSRYRILTSKDIQQRYMDATSRRKNVVINEDYRLIMYTQCQHNDDKSTQRKVKESKEKESKEECVMTAEPTAPTPRGEFSNVILTEDEYQRLKARFSNCDSSIERLSQYIASTGKKYNSHYAVLVKWAEEDLDKTEKPVPDKPSTSFDIDEFFNLSLERSNEMMHRKRAAP